MLKTVYGIWILTIPQQKRIRDLKHVDCSPRPIIIILIIVERQIVVNRFLLWIPKLTPKDSLYDKFVTSFLKETQWTYMREMYEVLAPTTSNGYFQI